MKNYSEMSRIEVNKAVADCEGLFWHCRPMSLQNESCHWLYSDNYCQCDTASGQVAVELPDYCNSWADMGPIIEREKITLRYGVEKHEEWLASCGAFERYCFSHKNPLRAAAIVYLMSKEN